MKLTQFIASIVPYRAFPTSDGDILIGGGNDRLFGIMCTRLGRPEWASDERFTTNAQRVKHREVLEPFIEDVVRTRTTQEWLEAFEGSGLPYAAINDIQETLRHKHSKLLHMLSSMPFRTDQWVAQARDMVQTVSHPACGEMKLVNTPVKYSDSRPSIRTPPPLLGQHTDEVLREVLGMQEGEVSRLREDGVVA